MLHRHIKLHTRVKETGVRKHLMRYGILVLTTLCPGSVVCCAQVGNRDARSLDSLEAREVQERPRPTNRVLQERFVREPMHWYRMTSLLTFADSGHSVVRMQECSPWHRWFNDEVVHREVFNGSIDSEVMKRAGVLETRWRSDFQHFLKTQDTAILDEFMRDATEFEQWLRERLAPRHWETLSALELRLSLLTSDESVVSICADSHPDDRRLSTEARERLNAEWIELCRAIKAEANELFLSELEALLPNFTSRQRLNEDALPILPIGVFIDLASEPEKRRKEWGELAAEFDVNATGGEWLFPTHVVAIRRNGTLKCLDRVLSGATVPASLLSIVKENVQFELSPSQFDFWFQEVNRLSDLSESERHASNIRRLSRDPRELRAYLFDLERQQNEQMIAQLIPPQIEAIRDYGRLHALFALGPHVIHDQLSGSSSNHNGQFEKRLRLVCAKLDAFSQEAISRVEAFLKEHDAAEAWKSAFATAEGVLPIEFILRSTRVTKVR